MIAFWIFALVVVALLDRVHADLDTANAEKHAFRLYALRDELRAAVIDGRVRSSNWVFQYLDSSIAKTIAALPSFTIWSLLYIAVTYRGDRRIKRAAAHLARELEKPENACLADLHTRHIDILGEFLLARHFVLRLVVASLEGLLESIRAGQRLLRLWQRALELSTETPETSTLADFTAA
jgi:hypothetical protein